MRHAARSLSASRHLVVPALLLGCGLATAAGIALDKPHESQFMRLRHLLEGTDASDNAVWVENVRRAQAMGHHAPQRVGQADGFP